MDNGIGTPSITGTIKEPEEQGVINTETPDTEIPKASDYLVGNTRQVGELYCDFKCRLFWEKQLLKRYLKGRSIWIGVNRGEARNPERRLRDSKMAIRKRARQAMVDAIRWGHGLLERKDVKCRNKKTKRAFIQACENNHGSN